MGRKRSERASSQYKKQTKHPKPGAGGSGGMTFKDRSGKTHGVPGRAGHGHGEAPAGKGHEERGHRGIHDQTRDFGDHKRNRDHDRGRGPGRRDEGHRGKAGREAKGDRGPRGRGQAVTLKATIDKNHKGFGFLIFENRQYEDTFVPPREAEAFFHGDRVEVVVTGRGEVQSIRVIEHRFRELVGRFMAHPAGASRGGWVVYERKRAREEVYVPKASPKLKTGEWVKAKLEFHEKGPFPVTAEITEVYGETLPPSADLGMVAAEYNLIEEHSAAAEKEARAHRLEIPGKDLEGRTDLRHVPFITIDGETARDFDDAVYVERTKHGYTLWVAIADVSHYVTEGSALDTEARSRGTSVYFPEKAFHMLPRALSENLCSLRPNEPRLSMVSRIECDRHGKRLHTEILEAVIESKRRATYNQIQAEWEQNKKNRDWEYAPHFELYQQIRKQRSERGSIDFDLPEAELKVEPTGEVISILQRPRLDAHRLIEEFMISANEAVTEWMMEKAWPFVYRIHEEPAYEALVKFQKLAGNMGVKFSIERASSPKMMAELVRRLEGHPAQELLNMALLRSLKQAIYSSTHGIHYGLASTGYTHFTSPIRRYPDLVVHRLLRWALRSPLSKDERADLEETLAEVCEHCSYRERIASDAERESIKLKQVRAMIPKLGEVFEAKISGMTDNGLFVQISEPYCEGLVPTESFSDDFYQFNEERMVFFGYRKKKTYRIGDRIQVRAVRADIDRRQIDFGVVT